MFVPNFWSAEAPSAGCHPARGACTGERAKMRRSREPTCLAFALAMTAVASSAVPALAQGKAVDLQLVLAVDVSLSMNQTEQRIQRDGYIAAFKSPEVMQAIGSGPIGRIAVTYIEWSGWRYQRIVVPWQVIGDEQEARQFADALQRAPIGRDNRTSISV